MAIYPAETAAALTVWGRAAFATAAVVVTLSAPAEVAGVQAGSGTWTTRPAHTLRLPGSEADTLEPRGRLRIGAGGTRIVVLTVDLMRRFDWRLSIWDSDGAMLMEAESQDIAEGVSMPGLRADANGFKLSYSDRYVWYEYEDARPLRTDLRPAGMERFATIDGGGLFRLGRTPGWFDAEGVTPETQAIIHAERVDEGWEQDTIGFLDIRHRPWYVELPPDSSRPNLLLEVTGAPQPFADDDLSLFDLRTGSVVVVRRNAGPGTAEVTELLASGDTAWHRSLILEVMPLAPERAEEIIEARLARQEAEGRDYLRRPDARRVIKEAIHVPSHLPAVTRMMLTASGEVWLRTPREEDGMAVWHSIPRGAEEVESRRVLLPTTFQLRDAFGDHVWGFLAPDDAALTAVGLLLVPPPG